MKNINEIIRTPSSWTKNDSNLSNTYLNIANVLPVVKNWMKSHVDNVKNGEGIINLGDIKEALKFLEESINNRLRSSVSNRVTITLSASVPTSSVPTTANTSSISESKRNKQTIHLKESELKHMISESVKRVINEYVSMKHSGHNMDDFLDDNDFIEIVNRVVRMYDAEDFNENDLDNIDDMEMEIADLIFVRPILQATAYNVTFSSFNVLWVAVSAIYLR